MRRYIVLCVSLLTFLTSGRSWAMDLADYRTETTAGLTFHYPEQYESASLPLRSGAPGYIRALEEELEFDGFTGIHVWLVREVADYFSLQGAPNPAPKWAAGLSLNNQSLVIIAMRATPGSNADDFVTTFHHELVHVALDRAAGGHSLPRWFHEGFATMHADEWSPERSEMLSRGAAQGALTPFADLTSSFPEHHNSASLAYAQSFHFVREWKTRYGADVYAKTLKRVRDGEPFQKAFRNVTDDSVMVAEARWLQNLKDGSSLWSMFNDGMLVFFGASILFLVAWLLRRNRNAQKLQSMDSDGTEKWDYDESKYPLS